MKWALNLIKHYITGHPVKEQTTVPQQRDLNRTREGLMDAAQKEFAPWGFAGARTDAIAGRAGVHERLSKDTKFGSPAQLAVGECIHPCA